MVAQRTQPINHSGESTYLLRLRANDVTVVLFRTASLASMSVTEVQDEVAMRRSCKWLPDLVMLVEPNQ